MRTAPAKILVHPANQSASAFYRIAAPAASLRLGGHATTIARDGYLSDEELKIAAPDVIVVQQQYTDAQIRSLKRYRKVLPKTTLVYETDDLVWATDPTNPAHAGLPKDVKRRIKAAIKICDVVTTSTTHLALELRNATGADVRIIPNYLPSRFINEAIAGRRDAMAVGEHTLPRIGWAGGASHGRDIAFLREVVQQMEGQATFVFLGLLPEGVKATDPGIEYHEAVSLEDYPRKLGSLNLDLALAPLVEDAFNNCKSDLKILEYGACGYAVLADFSPAYNLHRHIFRAISHHSDQWRAAIENILAGDAKAQGELLHEHVKNDFILESKLGGWQSAWSPWKAETFTPGDAVENQFVRRDLTFVPADLEEKMTAGLGQLASMSVLHNEGVYPLQGSFAPVARDLAIQIAEAADFANYDAAPCPYPTGPAVMLSGVALGRIGAPDVKRYGDFNTALLDWGARALEAGLGHGILTSSYAAASAPTQHAKQTSEWTIRHVAFWCPFFVPMVVGYGDADPLADVRRATELSFMRREYFGDSTLPRVLLINATEADVQARVETHVVFVAELSGHYLNFQFPQMPNVPPIDTREKIDPLIEILGRLGIPEIHFGGIGKDGTFAGGCFIADVAEAGWTVTTAEQPEEPPHYLRVSQTEWDALWSRFNAR